MDAVNCAPVTTTSLMRCRLLAALVIYRESEFTAAMFCNWPLIVTADPLELCPTMLKLPVCALWNDRAFRFERLVVTLLLTMPGLTAFAIVASGQARPRMVYTRGC